jgi:thymidine kinase
MFSGKSTELLRRMRRYACAQYNCVVIKYKQDIRYSDEQMATHDRQTMPAFPCMKLAELPDPESYDCIGIDEGQFFPDLVSFCEEMANLGKVLVVAALDGTFQRKSFNSVLDLIPLAEDVIKLSAVCMTCHRPAAFSKRIVNDSAVEVIGGADKYISVCRACFHRHSGIATPDSSESGTEQLSSDSSPAEPIRPRGLFPIGRPTFAGAVTP